MSRRTQRRLQILEARQVATSPSALAVAVRAFDRLTDAELAWLEGMQVRRLAAPHGDDRAWARTALTHVEQQELARITGKLAPPPG